MSKVMTKIQREKFHKKTLRSKAYKDIAHWTEIIAALNGELDGDEIDRVIDRPCASYGPGELFKYVSPTSGPFGIAGPNALKAWNSVTSGPTKRYLKEAFGVD
ncbi:MAG: hypothetical protein ACTSQY_02770 [Candidatus Odinarchaeia archaeon]